jgi:hypothetical protein
VVRRWTLAVLGLCVLLFVYHVFADRFTPFTSQGAVAAFVVPISPEVAGVVTTVEVIDNQRVRAGDVLALRCWMARFRHSVKAPAAPPGRESSISRQQFFMSRPRFG